MPFSFPFLLCLSPSPSFYAFRLPLIPSLCLFPSLSFYAFPLPLILSSMSFPFPLALLYAFPLPLTLTPLSLNPSPCLFPSPSSYAFPLPLIPSSMSFPFPLLLLHFPCPFPSPIALPFISSPLCLSTSPSFQYFLFLSCSIGFPLQLSNLPSSSSRTSPSHSSPGRPIADPPLPLMSLSRSFLFLVQYFPRDPPPPSALASNICILIGSPSLLSFSPFLRPLPTASLPSHTHPFPVLKPPSNVRRAPFLFTPPPRPFPSPPIAYF